MTLNEKDNKEPVLPKAIATGNLQISDGDTNIILPCVVLDDGRRVLSERGVNRALGRSYGGSDYKRKGGSDGAGTLPIFLGPTILKPFISADLAVLVANPIIYRQFSGGGVAHGIEAAVLPEICSVWLKAREARVLENQQPQLRIAAQAERLIRGLAHVGIIALVDEATGYQARRDRDDLQKLLAVYLTNERLAWAKVFPDEYYKHLFRLRGWPYSPPSVHRSGYVGKLTNQLVYERLPPGVLGELKRLNPVDEVTKRRKLKHHQFCSEDIGQPDLKNHLQQLIAIMRISANWDKFKRYFVRAFPMRNEQQELDFDED